MCVYIENSLAPLPSPSWGYFQLNILDYWSALTTWLNQLLRMSIDSFISINFENNGKTSWEKEKESYQLEHSKASRDHRYQHITKKKEIFPQLMQRPLLTWSKQIGRIIQVISFRRQSSAKVKGDDDGLSRSSLKPSPLTKKKTHSLKSSV